jgi:low affinity Fe/Cu permease
MSFRKLAQTVANLVGSPYAFSAALTVVALWGLSGPVFGFSDTWQLVINTATTIVTFLMVFLIQNTQNRDSKALHIKLDELIVMTKGADNAFADLEGLSDDQLQQLEGRFRELAARSAPPDAVPGEEDARLDSSGDDGAGPRSNGNASRRIRRHVLNRNWRHLRH